MLSHLRFHRRAPSNPTSPGPDQQQSPSQWESAAPSSQFPAATQDGFLAPSHPPAALDPRPKSSNSSSLPPTLPPIQRVSSVVLDPSDLPDFDAFLPPTQVRGPAPHNRELTPHREPPRPPPARSLYDQGSGFIGGAALHRLGVQRAQPGPELASSSSAGMIPRLDAQPYARPPQAGPSAGNTNTLPPTISRPPPQPVRMGKAASSFVMPTDLQNSNANLAAGRRPAGTRLATEPPTMATKTPSTAPVAPADPPKGKKGLPFLKNPMSTLLMRRKQNQNVPDLLPLPIHNHPDVPAYQPLRGTMVHDFSAPRPRRPVPNQGSAAASRSTHPEPPPIPVKSSRRRRRPPEQGQYQQRMQENDANAADSSQVIPPTTIDVQQNSEWNPGVPDAPRPGQQHTQPPQPTTAPPAPPPKDSGTASIRSRDSQASTVSSRAVSSETHSTARRPNASTRTNRSGTVSLSDGNHSDVLSSIPKHMKSTSSRFSFDMIGAAKQEKLLEERHRQKAAERKTVESASPTMQRDSRFDDLDDFDYDAMMDDDGLEEPIPGVNADYDDFEEPIPGINADYEEEPVPEIGDDDYEEPIPGMDDDYEELIPGMDDDYEEQPVPEGGHDNYDDDADPDNDQENFSGFVFQRSNPASTLTSPQSVGMMATPRDADGRVIGFAMSKDGPETPVGLEPQVVSSPSHATEPDSPRKAAELTGLAMQGAGISGEAPAANDMNIPPNHTIPPFVERRNRAPDDDLYYNDGMIGLEGEFDNEFEPGDDGQFDESIFDNNDTDEHGRPIPGAFARAQAAQLAVQSQSKRESDITSRLSAQSAVSESTGHTSISVGGQHFVSADQSKLGSEEISPRKDLAAPMPTLNSREQEYQAALAAAAYQAAASGKFRRNSSPPSPNAKSMEWSTLMEEVDPYDAADQVDFDDYEKDGLDDYELDDDAIIAEANASALANDSDGWYGQEFGFYSAPIQQHHVGHVAANGPNYTYSNGGYFGPSGIGRTISGRAISREPNLTPITERSEYSNRNSIMSLLPPVIGSGHSSLHSPGLAQLAMMAEGGSTDDMTLSALLRLRSRAWGGSQASLVSSKDGSPRSERGDGTSSPWGAGPGGHLVVGVGGHRMHERKNSSFSVLSRESEPVSESGSPTLTMAVPVITSAPPPLPPIQTTSLEPTNATTMGPPPPRQGGTLTAPPAQRRNTDPPVLLGDNTLPTISPFTPFSRSAEFSGLVASGKSPDVAAPGPFASIKGGPPPPPGPPSSLTRSSRPGMGHRHKGSADSISYEPHQEQDSGEMRWIMKRQRMAESGEVEIVEEVLEGGRI